MIATRPMERISGSPDAPSVVPLIAWRTPSRLIDSARTKLLDRREPIRAQPEHTWRLARTVAIARRTPPARALRARSGTHPGVAGQAWEVRPQASQPRDVSCSRVFTAVWRSKSRLAATRNRAVARSTSSPRHRDRRPGAPTRPSPGCRVVQPFVAHLATKRRGRPQQGAGVKRPVDLKRSTAWSGVRRSRSTPWTPGVVICQNRW